MTGKYSDCGKGFARLAKTMGRNIGGKPLCLYHDGEYREEDEQGSHFQMPGLGLDQGGGVAGVGADLDELGVSRGIDGVEVHCVALRRADVVDLAAAAEQLDEDSNRKERSAASIPARRSSSKLRRTRDSRGAPAASRPAMHWE